MMDTLLHMSMAGTIVICVVLALRLCLRRAPKIFSYALWLVVLFRLLCPVSVALPVSVFNLIPAAQATVSDQLPAREHPGNEDAVLTERSDGTDRAEEPAEIDVSVSEGIVSEYPQGSWTAMGFTSPGNWRNIMFCVWLTGVCAMFFWAVISTLQLHKRLKAAVPDSGNIYLLEGIASPFVSGIIRPRIYLPCGLGEHERTYILLHEQTHIRRGDPLFRALAYAALMLHWFNPFVWAAFFLSGRDMEMSCDEHVLRRLGGEIRCDYSDSLLAMSQGKRSPGFAPLAFGEGDTGKRIKNVLNYKKTTVRVMVVGVMVVALAGIALGADATGDGQARAAGDTPEQSLTVEYTPEHGQTPASEDATEAAGPLPADTPADEQTETATASESLDLVYAPDSDAPADSAVIATISVRTVSRSARCIDNYVIPDGDWEKTYGSELAFAEDCKFYINSSRTTMDAKKVTFSKFADAISAGDPVLNKPCVVEIREDDHLVHVITLVSEHYRYGVSYATMVGEGIFFNGFCGDATALDPDYYSSLELVRTEHMDLAAAPGEETVEIYTGAADGGSHGEVVFRDVSGNPLYYYAVDDSGRCWQNIYVGRIDGGGDPYLLELNLENRDTYGEYSFYVYSLGAEGGTLMQTAGSRIEWVQDGSLIYDPDEMLMFFHELGHYLYNSHLLVGMEDQKIRTDPVCDVDRYTYANYAPTCFPDPYEGQDVR